MKFFTANKKIILLSFFFVVFAFGPLGFDTALAQSQQTIANIGNLAASKVPEVPGAVDSALGSVFANLLMIPITLSAWILGVSGVLLNWVLEMTVVNMKTNLDSISGINIAWSVIRDLSNMVFIFSLLYVSIGTILKLNGADWKKTLTAIVTAAVLINFSLLMTKVIVDASNIMTLGIYRQIVPNDGKTNGLSNKIMSNLGVTTLFAPDKQNELAKQMGNNLMKIGIVSIGSSVFMLAAAFSFISVGIMFIIRYVTIIFLLIFSPVAMMASVLKGLSSQSKKWWDQLLGQAMFGPMYMILTWVTLTIISSPGFVCKTATGEGLSTLFTDAVGKGADISAIATQVSGNCTPMGMLFNFIIVIAFLIGTLTISKDQSAQKGGQAAALVGGALGFSAGTLGGFAARNTIGRGANAFLKSKVGTALQARGSGLLKPIKLAANSSFDVRNSKAVSRMASSGQIDLGKAAGSGGYVAQKKSIDEFFTRPGSDAAKKKAEEVRKAQTKIDISAGVSAPVGSPEHTAMLSRINRMTPKEISQLSSKQLQTPSIVSNLSPQQFEEVMKSDNHTDEDKEKMKNVRFSDINMAFNAPPGAGRLAGLAALKNRIRGLSLSELEALNPAYLSDPEFVDQLSTSQIGDILKSNRFTQSQKDKVRGVRNELISKALEIGSPTYNIANAIRRVRELDAKDAAKLISADYLPMAGSPPSKILLNKDVLSSFTSQKLKAMALVMDPADIAAIRTAILTTHAGYTPLDRLRTWLGTPDADNNFN